jgi:predicted Zn-dependent protease
MRALLVFFVLAAFGVVDGCATSPLGRRQLMVVSASEMDAMGVQAFQEMKKETPQVTDSAMKSYVQCVAQAVTREAGGPNAPRAWEVVVFKDDSANAFALPGGKIGVHSGLLKTAKTQDQLAAVIGHEVAHVLAAHANERVSTSVVAQSGTQLAAAVAGASGVASQQTALALLGLGTQVGVLLPFSRTQEREADLIGLDLMAAAGFDPRQSIDLWRNMEAAGGGKPPEFLSTHPGSESRIRDLQARLPTAMPIYEQARGAGKRPSCS